MQVVVDQLLTQYELTGKGRLVLVLHGWGDSSKGFSDLQKKLAEQFQILAVDLPGFGGTQTPKSVWDLNDYADFLKSLLIKLKLSQPFAVIGHSNGGALAILATANQTVQPEKLVLIAASGIRNNQRLKRLVLKIVAKIGNIATIWMPERYRRALRKSLYGVAGSDIMVVPTLEETFKKTVRQDVQKEAVKIKIPTLLIYSENDRAVPIQDGRQYAKLIENSRLEVVPDAEHFIHRDQPEKVTSLIKEFLT